MFRTAKHLLSLFVIIFILILPVFAVSAAVKTAQDKASEGLDKTARTMYSGSADGNLQGAIVSLPTIIGRAVGGLLAFVGTAFLLLMIYAGVMWMTAGGNEQTVAKAKSVIEAAAIGIIIVILAYALTSYIGQVLKP
ncbi:MAG: hypothetical protein ABH881_03535 [bacterium]